MQRDAVLRFAKDQARYPALVEILERRPPRARLVRKLEEAALSLDGSYLFVQGPPGSGKTCNGARMAIALMKAGQRVGVTALSHKAIHKFLEEVEEAAHEQGYRFHGLKKCGKDRHQFESRRDSSRTPDENAEMLDPELQLLAGTSLLFSREELDQHVDTLFVDEGGQFALADALAVGTAARNLVLLGDPNQLAQVSQGAHPPGANASVLSHLLGEHETVPPDMGLFLEHTWRMRPEVNAFVSETFYEGRLEPAEALRAVGRGRRRAALRSGRARGQPDAVARGGGACATRSSSCSGRRTEMSTASGRCSRTTSWSSRPTTRRCAACARRPDGGPVGTVDKFQGQEAPVVFFSMARSSGEDVPRDIEFLFSRNRLNVAISRARCLAILVASPKLLDIPCRTVEQMRLANALCRFVEQAEGGVSV